MTDCKSFDSEREAEYLREASARMAHVVHHSIVSTLDWVRQYGGQMCQSPIERLFLLAWVELVETYRRTCIVSATGDPVRWDIAREMQRDWVVKQLDSEFLDMTLSRYDLIVPQYQIGRYRVDFLVARWDEQIVDRHDPGALPDLDGSNWEIKLRRQPLVVIECDGFDYHDRTPHQANRDKARDRELQQLGYNVFRFTGSQLTASPFACAAEVDRMLGDESEHYSYWQEQLRVEVPTPGKEKLRPSHH